MDARPYEPHVVELHGPLPGYFGDPLYVHRDRECPSGFCLEDYPQVFATRRIAQRVRQKYNRRRAYHGVYALERPYTGDIDDDLIV